MYGIYKALWFQILASCTGTCMDQTPKKIIGNNCFLCSIALIHTARIRVFGMCRQEFGGHFRSDWKRHRIKHPFVERPVHLYPNKSSISSRGDNGGLQERSNIIRTKWPHLEIPLKRTWIFAPIVRSTHCSKITEICQLPAYHLYFFW